MKRKYLYVILMAIFILIGTLSREYGFSEETSIKKSNTNKDDSIEILLRKETFYGSAVLYKNIDSRMSGIAKIEKSFGFLWKVKSNTKLKYLDEGEAFTVIGEHIRNSDEEEQLMIGFQTNDSEMAYVICGPEDNQIEDKLEKVSKEAFVNSNPAYHLTDILDGYALIVQKEYDVINWNFYVFDENDRLIATKIAGTGDAIYVE
ncbi:hypothetical protein EZV73_01675 [Acidaminobacter sp. JC074]|uniref:hypothetical protein n=1 Tax=Acidaminobacter sp. JC074 TaxID=2530199 RepID=UPI001F1130CA|nr:hypothetical protein [Acidaminobacter sp. JC074]MCH4886254.1 hypothetical protein [Acidaminobacter sp. JC074]